MTTRPAAYVGSSTQHGAPLVGTGTPTVIINGRPAWPAGLPHVCAVHGPEAVGMGSETVIFNGMRAARANDGDSQAGDFLQGGGPPNQIMSGASNVLIGSPEMGLATAANQKTFCVLYCQLQHDWPTLTPAQRQTAYKDMCATMCATIGAPPISMSQGLQPGAEAAFDRAQWAIVLARGAWDAPQPPAGRATMHELRHCEQAFTAMRFNGGTGPTDANPAARSAAAHQPVGPNSAAGRFGHLHHDNEVALPGIENRDAVINEVTAAAAAVVGPPHGERYQAAVDAYYNQPGGADARTVEAPGECGGCP